MLSVVTAENKQVFDCELLRFTPSDFQTLVQLTLVFKLSSVEQIVNLLIVDL